MPDIANLDQLVGAMDGRSTTAGWDVVVSYSTKELNESLSKLWEADFFSKVEVRPKKKQGEIESDFEIALHRPTIKFIAQGAAVVRLEMGVSGRCWPDGKSPSSDVIEIELGIYSLTFEIPLVSVEDGERLSGDETSAEKAADSIVQFKQDSKETTRNIVMHFKNIPKETWELKPVDKEKASKLKATCDVADAVSELQAWFFNNVNDVEYKIAQVNNQKLPGGQSGVQLRPLSFVFASHGEGDDAVLSIYIQTDASGRAPGNTNPKFEISDNSGGQLIYRPLPKGYTAGMVIHHEVMRDNLFLPSLNAAVTVEGETQHAASNSLSPGARGFQFNVKVDRKFMQPVNEPYDFRLDFWNGSYSEVFGKGILLNLQDHPLVLRIEDGKAKWTLAYEDNNMTWQRNLLDGSRGFRGSIDLRIWVDTTAPPKDNPNGPRRDPIPLIPSQADLSLPTTAFAFVPRNEFHFDVKARDDPDPVSAWPLWKRFLTGGNSHSATWSNQIPTNFQNLEAKFADIKFHWQSLNFLCTKNVFAAGKDIVQIDTGVGLKTPHDVMLVGRIVPVMQ
ncbi:MAG: hypothetical protein M1837_004452 [Sclerophora amabilis]|nr:MAG: hypothetical protein M1837_004452 [Sclerophora amabilis]